MLFRISPFLGLIDDLSYFVYHNTTRYDIGFRFYSRLCWNWTNSKWRPPQEIAEKFGISAGLLEEPEEKWLRDRRGVTPARLRFENKEDLFFLNNCKGFLMYTVPISTLVFFLLWLLHNKIRKYKLSSILSTFSSWSYLLASLIGDNSQYLSFRSFSQLRFCVPIIGPLSLLNLILTLVVLFATLFLTLSLYFLALWLSPSTFKSSILRRSLRSFVLHGVWICGKFASGFVHAFIDGDRMRMGTILLIQVLMTASAVYGAVERTAMRKGAFAMLAIGQTFRLALYLVVYIEMTLGTGLTIVIDVALTQLTLVLVASLFGCLVLQILLVILSQIFFKK